MTQKEGQVQGTNDERLVGPRWRPCKAVRGHARDWCDAHTFITAKRAFERKETKAMDIIRREG